MFLRQLRLIWWLAFKNFAACQPNSRAGFKMRAIQIFDFSHLLFFLPHNRLYISGFSKWKKVSGGNFKIAGAPLRRDSGAGRQSRPWGGCGRGFPPPAGGVWGASPRKFWKSACSEVHSGAFSGPKSYFLGRCTLYYNLEFFLNLTHYQEFLENYVYSYILQCFPSSPMLHITIYI